MPTARSQCSRSPFITGSVSRELRRPVVNVFSGNASQPASMFMPEAAMDKDHLSARYESQIRSPRNVPPVQPKTVAHLVGDPAHYTLRAGIAPLDRGHDTGTFFRSSLQSQVSHLAAIIVGVVLPLTHARQNLLSCVDRMQGESSSHPGRRQHAGLTARGAAGSGPCGRCTDRCFRMPVPRFACPGCMLRLHLPPKVRRLPAGSASCDLQHSSHRGSAYST